MVFTKISFLPPPVGLKIVGYGSSFDNINFVKAQAEGGGEIFKIALNPLSYSTLDSLLGKSLDKAIKKAAEINPEIPFFCLDQYFSEIKGKVLVAKSFYFGDDIFSELFIEKTRDGKYVRIIFAPHYRNRKQGLNLAEKTVHVSQSKLKAVIDGRIKEWDGKNI